MRLIKMKYKDFEFEKNPQSVEVAKAKKISRRTVFTKGSSVSEIADNAAVITAKGMLYGENAPQLADELERLHDKRGSGMLLLPCGSCYDAYFSSLKLESNAQEGYISYSLEFVENENHRLPCVDFGYTYALKGENAFDIAGRCSVTVESIMKNNDIKTPFDIEEGERLVIE